MKNLLKIGLYTFIYILALPKLHADSLSGKITFEKRPPFSGIIYLKSTSASKKNASIDQTNKVFTSKISAGTPGAKAIFNNSDSHDHNIFANDINYGVNFDVGLIPTGGKSEVVMDWDDDSLIRIGCKIHPKMKAYIANINSNNYKVLEFDKTVLEYKFELSNLSSGEEKVILKLPKYDTVEVSLSSGESQTIDLLRKGKKKGTVTLSR